MGQEWLCLFLFSPVTTGCREELTASRDFTRLKESSTANQSAGLMLQDSEACDQKSEQKCITKKVITIRRFDLQSFNTKLLLFPLWFKSPRMSL